VGVPLNENLPNATASNQMATGIDSGISFALNFESALSWQPFAQRLGRGVFGHRCGAPSWHLGKQPGIHISGLESTDALRFTAVGSGQ
jgi:hypothetical protein